MTTEDKEEEEPSDWKEEAPTGLSTTNLSIRPTPSIPLSIRHRSLNRSNPYLPVSTDEHPDDNYGSDEEIQQQQTDVNIYKLHKLKMSLSKSKMDYPVIEHILVINSLINNKNEYQRFRQKLLAKSYDNLNLKTDLLNGLLENDPKCSLTALLPQQYQLESASERRKLFYSTLLYKYFSIKDMTQEDFIKLLKIHSSNIHSKVDIKTYNKIIIEKGLDGKTFDEMDETVFVTLFNSISNKTAQCGMIYKLIKKWEPDLDYKSIYKCLMNYEFGIEEHQFTQLKDILEK
eukprot:76558_1